MTEFSNIYPCCHLRYLYIKTCSKAYFAYKSPRKIEYDLYQRYNE